MNSLSWFLYLTDVVSSLGAFTVIASIGAGFALVAVWIWASFAIIDAPRDGEGKIRDTRATWTWRLVVMGAFAGFIACLLPSKNTMYAIAASEVGEKIAKSNAAQEIASDATKALQQWIKKQIEPEAKK